MNERQSSSSRTRANLLWFDVPIAALAVSSLVALNVAWNRTSAWRALGWLAVGMLMYLCLSRVCRPRARWRIVARALILSGAGVALYVVMQYPHLGYDAKLAPLAAVGRALGAFVPRVGNWTPFPNSVATFLEGLVPLSAALALGRGRPGWRIVSGVGGGVMALAVVLVASRGAWLALTVAFSMWALATILARRASRIRARVAVGGAAVGVALVVAAIWIEAGALSSSPILAAFDRPDRVDVYRNSLMLIGDFPFTGIGLGDQFAMALARYALLIQVPFLTYSHNLYLDIWLELGLGGIMSWVFLVGAVCGAVFVGERSRLGTRFQGTWVGLVAVLIHGLTDARQSVDGWTWLPFFGLLGLLAARLRRPGVDFGLRALAPPGVATAAFLVVAAPYLLPVRATWEANLGTVAQARAELGDPGAADRTQLVAEARRHYEEAVRLDSGQSTALRRLGILALDEHRFQEARTSLEAAWTAEPGHASTRKAFGLACAWTGELTLARDLLTPVSGIVDELNVWSWWWEEQGQRTQAVNAARLSLLMQPDQPAVARRLTQLESPQAQPRF